MEQKSVRLFVSSVLVSRAEELAGRKAGLRGRPMRHSSCLVLAMLGVKAYLGLGFRETERIFRQAGYANLPDFRTLQWRSARLIGRGLRMDMSIARGKDTDRILLMLRPAGDAPITVHAVSGGAMSIGLRGIRKEFVELML